MDWLSNILKIWGPRLLGSLAGAAAVKISEQIGVTVDPAVLIGIGTAVYSGVHKATSAKVNPGDASTGRVTNAIDKAANDPRASNTVTIGEKGS